jgi:hypothetical protein
MEISITFRDGPIDVEVSANEEESYIDVLEELERFVDEYGPTGYQMQQHGPQQKNRDDSPDKNSKENAGQESKSESTDSTAENSYLDRVNATDSELLRILKLGSIDGDEIKEFPKIIGNVDVLGESGQDRLLNGSIVLLTVLDEVHGISRVSTSNLKNALSDSGMNVDYWTNIGQTSNVDVYLNRRGSGSSATTAIREPGKEDAYEQIQTLVGNLQDQEPVTDE